MEIMHRLDGKRVAVLAADGFEKVELTVPVTALRAALADRNTARVFLRADGSIPYSRVVQIMGALNAAGITDIVLVTETGGPRMDAAGTGN